MALIVSNVTNNTDSVPGKLRAHLAERKFGFDKIITSPNYRYEVLVPVKGTSAEKVLERFGEALASFSECDFRLVDCSVVGEQVSIRIAAIGLAKKYDKKTKTDGAELKAIVPTK